MNTAQALAAMALLVIRHTNGNAVNVSIGRIARAVEDCAPMICASTSDVLAAQFELSQRLIVSA